MSNWHASCPYCGQRNENLYLDETDGLFECERCGLVTRIAKNTDTSRWAYCHEIPKEQYLHVRDTAEAGGQKKAV